MLTVADEAGIRDLDRLKAATASLADPRTLSAAPAEALIATSRPIYYFNAGLHADETGSAEAVLELAYRLAVSDQPNIRHIRKQLIVLINPVSNPDGRDKMVEWFYRYLKGKTNRATLPRQSPPYWSKYAFVDINRDTHQQTHETTKAVHRKRPWPGPAPLLRPLNLPVPSATTSTTRKPARLPLLTLPLATPTRCFAISTKKVGTRGARDSMNLPTPISSRKIKEIANALPTWWAVSSSNASKLPAPKTPSLSKRATSQQAPTSFVSISPIAITQSISSRLRYFPRTKANPTMMSRGSFPRISILLPSPPRMPPFDPRHSHL